MKRIGIVGSGISGLSAAYYLARDFDVTIFEKEHYLGGHTNTIEVEDPVSGEIIPIDTGFIVFNFFSYPNLVKFLLELNVKVVPSNMSFSVWDQSDNLYYAGTNFFTLFAQKRNLIRPKFYKLLKEILRFNNLGKKILKQNIEEIYDLTILEFLEKYNFDKTFQKYYLLPMSSAIWSTENNKILEFPIYTLLRFFNNHGLLGVNDHFQWYTVYKGSYKYIQQILNQQRIQYYLNEPVISVKNTANNKVEILSSKRRESFDYVIVATHAPTSMKIIKDLTPEQKQVLSRFQYQKNIAILHTDGQVMCPDKRIWSAWNYKIAKENTTSTVYYMTRLQPWIKNHYFVSINEFQNIQEEKIIKIIQYEHPVFDLEVIKNQEKLKQINEGPIYLAGAYFRYGFHEDGILSALDVVSKIKNKEKKYEFVNLQRYINS